MATTEGDLVWRGPDGEILDETKSVKVGLDREELMAEFAILAEEEREEAERAQAVFVEAVQNLKLYSQLDVETISNLLTVLEDSGRDEGVAWEYFFQQGAHQVLLVLLNAPEVVEDQRRTDQILRMWERIARFVFKLSAEDQAVVYEELRRQGMVETLALAMKHHPQHAAILRRAAFLLAQLFDHDAPDAPPSDEDPSALHRMRASDGLVSLFSAMEAQPDIFSPDLLVKVRGMREALEGKKSTSPSRRSEDAAAAVAAAKEEKEKEEEEEKRVQQEREQLEAEAKQTQDVEHLHKQQADKKLTSAERARMHEAALDAAPGPTEKAPLLAAHQRHAAGQVVTGDGCCSACVLM